MGAEDLGKQGDPQEPAGNDPKGATGDGSADPKAGATDPQEGDDPDESVVDSHGQPGINRERHDKEIAAKDARIAELEGKLEEASKTEQGRADLKKEIDKLRAEQADERVAHKLELAGCIDLKAAKSRLEDFDGDVAKLKESCPYLFGTTKKTGSTGGRPAGASDAIGDKIDAAMGMKKKG